ncbi:type VII secretion target [Mycobacterium sp. IDR2000157661]|uniref:type VII secretion target n=1 Tax=Mycobacterium sp. IDR2000157661 TaxID=2867005 RepID=UPI001EEB100C|nr:type VII secretion target [Mycobacterium sp. IDR2000157661]ULE33779.1 ESX-1 secretion-associated protein [Mycobacterium sp. IDR2000157661]
MGETDAAHVDVAALNDVARHYQGVADAIDDAVRTQLTALAFDGAAAGRGYTGRGDALRSAVDDVVTGLRQWSRASAEIAATLRASAERYADADARAARRVG